MKTPKTRSKTVRKTTTRRTPPKARQASGTLVKLAERASYALNKLAKKI